MAAQELCFVSIADLAQQIQQRSISPVEVTQAYLERIQAVDGQLNSYLTVTPERALAEAKAAETEIQAGTCRGPLHGIPLAHSERPMLFDEATVLQSGHAYETQTDWHTRRPAVGI